MRFKTGSTARARPRSNSRSDAWRDRSARRRAGRQALADLTTLGAAETARTCGAAAAAPARNARRDVSRTQRRRAPAADRRESARRRCRQRTLRPSAAPDGGALPGDSVRDECTRERVELDLARVVEQSLGVAARAARARLVRARRFSISRQPREIFLVRERASSARSAAMSAATTRALRHRRCSPRRGGPRRRICAGPALAGSRRPARHRFRARCRSDSTSTSGGNARAAA